MEDALDATSSIVVATTIINMWRNDAAAVSRSFQRIASKYPDRLLLGGGIGNPESIAAYRSPLEMMSAYFDELDARVHATRPRDSWRRTYWRLNTRQW